MWVPVFALPLAAHLVIAAADRVPNLDVRPSCRAAAAEATSKDRMQSCVDSEHKARDQLVKDWSSYPAADRTNCLSGIISFAPTYTELITCLEMERDVKQSRTQAQSKEGTVGAGSKEGTVAGSKKGTVGKE
jgi:hypothetical protein